MEDIRHEGFIDGLTEFIQPGKLDDGTQFDSSVGGEPLEFTIGGGQLIGGFDKAVEGMAVGDSKNVRIEPEDAYGPRHDELMQEIPRDALPEELDPEVGMGLQSQSPEGQVVQFVIAAVAEETITIDANHPLAGHVLNFDIELIAIA